MGSKGTQREMGTSPKDKELHDVLLASRSEQKGFIIVPGIDVPVHLDVMMSTKDGVIKHTYVGRTPVAFPERVGSGPLHKERFAKVKHSVSARLKNNT